MRAPHAEHNRVLGYDRGATHTSPPASTTLTPTRSRSRAIAASATAPANRLPRNIPRTDRSSTPTRAAILATDVDAVSVACRLTAATRAWSRASVTTAFRRFADPRHFLVTARPARRTRRANAAAPRGFSYRSSTRPSTDARTASVFTPTSSPALHAGAGRRRRSQSRLIDKYHASASRETRAVLTWPRQRTRSAIRIQPSFGTRTPRPSNLTSWFESPNARASRFGTGRRASPARHRAHASRSVRNSDRYTRAGGSTIHQSRARRRTCVVRRSRSSCSASASGVHSVPAGTHLPRRRKNRRPPTRSRRWRSDSHRPQFQASRAASHHRASTHFWAAVGYNRMR